MEEVQVSERAPDNELTEADDMMHHIIIITNAWFLIIALTEAQLLQPYNILFLSTKFHLLTFYILHLF